MPLYEYRALNAKQSCRHCKKGFEVLERRGDPPQTACPQCGSRVQRVISAPAVGASKTGLDERAKAKGFHKLKRVDKGTYEKMY